MMWTFLLMLCVTVTFIMTLAFCLCWRKKTPKSDWLGLDGMVTQKNPDENVNHLPSAASVTASAPFCVVDGPLQECNYSEQRNVPVNTRRSLPDIPSEQGDGVNWEPTGDNSSEHYATLGQYQNAKRHTLPNGIESRPSRSQQSSMSQADETFSPYERVKYDKIKSKEHPYAQLQPTTSRQAVLEENQADERTFMLRPETLSEPTAPPRSRRSSNHSSLNADIPAASAVAGGVAASPDLPYMTPPVQVNFSGDSQDSSKGYTSISVREPLANIIAQTKEMKREHRDQHYSTVSDDSDDVYTTIPDPNNQIYTSESETYARIPAHPVVVEAEINQPDVEDVYEPPPQPSHSRQASTSSSVANVGSPKPEKRQANSPLPPPPPSPRNLDDLYAKVHKNTKRKEEATTPSAEEVEEQPKVGEHNYETLKKQTDEPGYASINGPDSLISSDPGYEVLKQGLDPNYEELKRSNSNSGSEAGYSKIKSNEKSNSLSQDFSLDEPNYESMPSESDPNYESVSQLDPNYESVKEAGYEKIRNRGYENLDSSESSNGTEKMKSRLDPPYEQLSNDTDTEMPGYDKINSTEPNYATIEKNKGENSDKTEGDEEIFQV